MLTFILLLVLCITALYKFFTKNFDYFKNQGISGPTPIPVFGNWWGVWNKQYHQILLENQEKYGKIYGTFDGRIPCSVIADLEIARQVLVKDFADHFSNRRPAFESHPILKINIGSLRDEEWKDVRNRMSAGFTIGKIKKIYELMDACASSMISHLHSVCKTSTEINMKEIGTGYSLDVVSSCVFGIKLNSLRNPDDPFVKKAMQVVQGKPSPLINFIFILTQIYPQLINLIPVSPLSEVDFFTKVSNTIMKQKKLKPSSDEGIDYLDHLMEDAKRENSPFKDEKLVFAQVLVLMMAGFDTAATALTMILHCLAMDQTVQEKLRKEIKSAIQKHGGINYECMQNIPYLDQCISEASRLYPTISRLERECKKTVTYDKIKIEEGTIVAIPVYAIQNDPEIYPNPSKYDPERFSNEEKGKRDPLSYLHFGYGPRNCLGMRLAAEQLKLGVVHLINNFRFTPSEQTSSPPNFLNGIYVFFAMVAPKVCLKIEKC